MTLDIDIPWQQFYQLIPSYGIFLSIHYILHCILVHIQYSINKTVQMYTFGIRELNQMNKLWEPRKFLYYCCTVLTSVHHHRPSPANSTQQEVVEWCKDKVTNPRPTHCYPRCQCPPLFKVKSRGNHCRYVYEAKSNACNTEKCNVKTLHLLLLTPTLSYQDMLPLLLLDNEILNELEVILFPTYRAEIRYCIRQQKDKINVFLPPTTPKVN